MAPLKCYTDTGCEEADVRKFAEHRENPAGAGEDFRFTLDFEQNVYRKTDEREDLAISEPVKRQRAKGACSAKRPKGKAVDTAALASWGEGDFKEWQEHVKASAKQFEEELNEVEGAEGFASAPLVLRGELGDLKASIAEWVAIAMAQELRALQKDKTAQAVFKMLGEFTERKKKIEQSFKSYQAVVGKMASKIAQRMPAHKKSASKPSRSKAKTKAKPKETKGKKSSSRYVISAM